MSKSRVQDILMVFFNVSGLSHYKFLHQGQKINQHIDKDILQCLLRSVRGKGLEEWWDNLWLLDRDNVAAHKAQSIQQSRQNCFGHRLQLVISE